MMDKELLHLLIEEEIYLIEKEKSELVNNRRSAKPEEISSKAAEVQETEKSELAKIQVDEVPVIHKVEQPIDQIVPLAIFYEASKESEIVLLQKIIDACKLNPNRYQVFANGFNKEVKFKKAIVFISRAKAYYKSIPYQDSQILCSKPLAQIADDTQEKAKLWKALQGFV